MHHAPMCIPYSSFKTGWAEQPQIGAWVLIVKVYRVFRVCGYVALYRSAEHWVLPSLAVADSFVETHLGNTCPIVSGGVSHHHIAGLRGARGCAELNALVHGTTPRTTRICILFSSFTSLSCHQHRLHAIRLLKQIRL